MQLRGAVSIYEFLSVRWWSAQEARSCINEDNTGWKKLVASVWWDLGFIDELSASKDGETPFFMTKHAHNKSDGDICLTNVSNALSPVFITAVMRRINFQSRKIIPGYNSLGILWTHKTSASTTDPAWRARSAIAKLQVDSEIRTHRPGSRKRGLRSAQRDLMRAALKRAAELAYALNYFNSLMDFIKHA